MEYARNAQQANSVREEVHARNALLVSPRGREQPVVTSMDVHSEVSFKNPLRDRKAASHAARESIDISIGVASPGAAPVYLVLS